MSGAGFAPCLPAATGGLEQNDTGIQTASKQQHRRALGVELAGQRGHDVQVTHRASLVLVKSNGCGLSRRGQRLGLNVRLAGEEIVGGKVVFHFLKRREDRLPVGGEAFVVNRPRLAHLGADLAGLEQGHDRTGTQ